MAKHQSLLEAMRRVVANPPEVDKNGTPLEKAALQWYSESLDKFMDVYKDLEKAWLAERNKRQMERERRLAARKDRKQRSDPGAERSLDLIEEFFSKRGPDVLASPQEP